MNPDRGDGRAGRGDAQPHVPARPDPVPAALATLRRDGVVVLPGAHPAAVHDVGVRGRGLVTAGIVLGSLGAVLLLVGVTARVVALFTDDLDVWALFSLLVFPGILLLTTGGALWLGSLLMRLNVQRRSAADPLPVVLEREGFRVRGAAIAWTDVEAPLIASLTVRGDVSGRMAVMPLTERGRRRINAWPFEARELVGPREYLRSQVRYALLPGIQGYTEAEVMRVFGEARELAAATSGEGPSSTEAPLAGEGCHDGRPPTGTETI